jgi:hypothetical protein
MAPSEEELVSACAKLRCERGAGRVTAAVAASAVPVRVKAEAQSAQKLEGRGRAGYSLAEMIVWQEKVPMDWQ